MKKNRLAIIGCVGIPNRYGGFESFAEHLSPFIKLQGMDVIVTCERNKYLDDLSVVYKGIHRKFIGVKANGVWSPLHDLISFLVVFRRADYVLALGVSGGIFFPIFRLLCWVSNCCLIVNIDGVEWRRSKFGIGKKLFLYVSDWLAQRFSHKVIFDNLALNKYVHYLSKSYCVAYSGDHALLDAKLSEAKLWAGGGDTYALTICRIEPENNCEMLIEGFLKSSLSEYKFIGNWDASEYGRKLRSLYAGHVRLQLLDPIYDSNKLFELRANCSHYIHGHSVGGTNPSLVEMLFFNCILLCFDCQFNRHTAKNGVFYFSDNITLASVLNAAYEDVSLERTSLRETYSASSIVKTLLYVIRK